MHDVLTCILDVLIDIAHMPCMLLILSLICLLIDIEILW